MENNLNYSSEVRKKILSMLMFQLYSDERTIYREYVQNALDSINKAIDTTMRFWSNESEVYAAMRSE